MLLLLLCVREINKSRVAIFLALLIYTQFTGLISCFVVEFGFFITEQGVNSHNNNATLVYTTFLYLLFGGYKVATGVLFMFFKHDGQIMITSNYRDNALIVATILLFVLYINVLLSDKIPLFNASSTRFTFWDADAFLKPLKSFVGVLSIPIASCLGILFVHYRQEDQRKKVSCVIVLIVLYLFYLALTGQRFNGFIVAIFFFITPIFYFRTSLDISFFSLKNIFLTSGAIVLMFTLVLASYAASEGGIIDEAGGSPIKAALYRIFILQGHVFWGQWEYFVNNGVVGTQFFSDAMLSSINLLASSPSFFITNGINLANVFPGNLILAFGLMGASSVVICMSFYLAIIAFVIKANFDNGRIIGSVITLQILLWVVGAMPNWDFSQMFGVKVISAWALYFFYLLACKASK
jgi:hypothetical protein